MVRAIRFWLVRCALTAFDEDMDDRESAAANRAATQRKILDVLSRRGELNAPQVAGVIREAGSTVKASLEDLVLKGVVIRSRGSGLARYQLDDARIDKLANELMAESADGEPEGQD